MQTKTKGRFVVSKTPKESCPICQFAERLLVAEGKKAPPFCSFFTRCQGLKFDDDPKVSAKKRSEYFRRFHADVCQTCRLPLDQCRASKVRRAIGRRKREVREAIETNPHGPQMDAYMTPEQITAAADAMECKPPRLDYAPKKPSWYSEK